jgi:hypothetical protein
MMKMFSRRRVGVVAVIVCGVALTVSAQEATNRSNCKPVHASMIEDRVTVGCKPGHSFCFLGEVTGNHDLRGTTYFRGDGSGSRPTTSPDFLPYSGVFEYYTAAGTLIMRETGVSNTTQGNPDSGAVTAFQKVTDATGEWAGATGYFFVSGFNRNGHVETSVTGEICIP